MTSASRTAGSNLITRDQVCSILLHRLSWLRQEANLSEGGDKKAGILKDWLAPPQYLAFPQATASSQDSLEGDGQCLVHTWVIWIPEGTDDLLRISSWPVSLTVLSILPDTLQRRQIRWRGYEICEGSLTAFAATWGFSSVPWVTKSREKQSLLQCANSCLRASYGGRFVWVANFDACKQGLHRIRRLNSRVIMKET
jgi:hypothetical protein